MKSKYRSGIPDENLAYELRYIKGTQDLGKLSTKNNVKYLTNCLY